MGSVVSQKNNGFTLIEALVAAAFVAIGFAGVYGLVQGSTVVFERSLAKEQRRYVHDEILDYLSDRHWRKEDIDKYDGLRLDSDCASFSDEIFDITERNYLARWCARIQSERQRLSQSTTDYSRLLSVYRNNQNYWVATLSEEKDGDVRILDLRLLIDPLNQVDD